MTPKHQDPPSEASRPPDLQVVSDESAEVAEFIAENRECFLGYAFRVCGSLEISEDAVQDLYPVLKKHWHKIENPQAWSRRVISKRAINIKLSQRREISIASLPEDMNFPFQADIATPHDVFAATELQQEIRRLIAELPDEKRMILIMSLHRIPQEEIAKELNMSHGAVRTAWCRIRNDLARCLGVPEQRVRGIKRGADSNDEKEGSA